jgi:hypothetical protein
MLSLWKRKNYGRQLSGETAAGAATKAARDKAQLPFDGLAAEEEPQLQGF